MQKIGLIQNHILVKKEIYVCFDGNLSVVDVDPRLTVAHRGKTQLRKQQKDLIRSQYKTVHGGQTL